MSAKDMVDIALSQVGYLEKKSNYDLDSFTGNAGNKNYTKYARDIWPSLQAQPWCDIFVSWCAEQVGEKNAVGKYAYCPDHVIFFKQQGRWYSRGNRTPQAGDIIFFQSGGEASHVGIVTYSSSGYVYTVEGNTSGASGLISNGGGVCKKSYSLSSSYILGYGVPKYSGTSGGTSGGGTVSEVKTEDRYNPWRKWSNGSTVEPVFRDSDLTYQVNALGQYKTAYCMCRYGGAYLITYKIDGTADDWATGWVKYWGGV